MSRLQVDITDDNFVWLKKTFPRRMNTAIDQAISLMRACRSDGDCKEE